MIKLQRPRSLLYRRRFCNRILNFKRSFHDLQDLDTFAPLQIQTFSKIFKPNVIEILRMITEISEFLKNSDEFSWILTEFWANSDVQRFEWYGRSGTVSFNPGKAREIFAAEARREARGLQDLGGWKMRPYHSNLCTSEFSQNSVRIQQNYHNFSEVLKILGLLNIF